MALEDNHPYKPPPSMLSTIFLEPPFVVDIDNVLGSINLFPKGNSCGRDVLRDQQVLDVLCGEGSTISKDLLYSITYMVNLCLAGRCPSILAEFVAYAPLTPLLIPDKGIQPIVIGTIWRRLVSKLTLKGVGK